MTHELKLENVINYQSYVDPTNIKREYYSSTARNKNAEIICYFTLDNGNYISPEVVSQLHIDDKNHVSATMSDDDGIGASRTFDCKFDYVTAKEPSATKEILEIKGLKIKGKIEYDGEKHVLTARTDQNQNFTVEYSGPQDDDKFCIHSHDFSIHL
ncbi:hypothetical protein [Wolbachia endosymbiont (group E) of Neria commutata]|uniref:hypothetical protein n=1 Tax=Wolbachia endosymbiont (group E) of Neria commutata TaxID=3066149 RepID=UPI003132D5E6